MTDAGAGLDTGDGGVFDTGGDQSLSPAGDQQIHSAVCGHQLVGALAGGVLHQQDRVLDESCRRKAFPQRVNDRGGAGVRLFAAAQHTDVAALQREGCRIGGDVGPALIDDGDHAHGDRGLFDHQTVAAFIAPEHPADRTRKRRDLADTLCHPGNALGSEQQAVDHHVADHAARRIDIACVRGEDAVDAVGEAVRHREQGAVDVLCRERAERRLCLLCLSQ